MGLGHRILLKTVIEGCLDWFCFLFLEKTTHTLLKKVGTLVPEKLKVCKYWLILRLAPARPFKLSSTYISVARLHKNSIKSVITQIWRNLALRMLSLVSLVKLKLKGWKIFKVAEYPLKNEKINKFLLVHDFAIWV